MLHDWMLPIAIHGSISCARREVPVGVGLGDGENLFFTLIHKGQAAMKRISLYEECCGSKIPIRSEDRIEWS